MEEFKLTKIELEALSKKIYEEACYGYLDLKDSVCERLVGEFLDDKKPYVDDRTTQAMPQASPAYTPPYVRGLGSTATPSGGGCGSSTGTGATWSNPTWSTTGATSTTYIGTGTGQVFTYTVDAASSDLLRSDEIELRDNTIDLRSTGF